MVIWYWYLLAMAGLSLAQYLRINLALILVLALLVHIPLPEKLRRYAALRIARVSLLVLAAAGLMWKATWLPPPSTIIKFMADPHTRPSWEYIRTFLVQSVNPWILGTGIALLFLLLAAKAKKPILTIISAYALVLAAWIIQPQQYSPEFSPASLEEFFNAESRKRVAFTAPASNSDAFDIIILHLCSISWDDMKNAEIDPKSFFGDFDYLFTDFSAACTYSTPSAIRVLRSACGQTSHTNLFAETDPACYLMDGLRKAGYNTHSLFNHDGKYADFTNAVQKYGHADPPLAIENLPVASLMFDNSPMTDDGATLLKYLEMRQSTGAVRAALYYNSASLHLGSYEKDAPRQDSVSEYKLYLNNMLGNLRNVFKSIEASGRKTVVIVLPEHGAALFGSKLQARDVRDIPLPAISTIPVGIKIFAPGHHTPGKPQIIAKPTSLFAVAWILAKFTQTPPFGSTAPDPAQIALEIPYTAFVAENENSIVMKSGPLYLEKSPKGEWAALPASVALPQDAVPDFK